MAQIPIIGRVAAGVPILAEQNIEGYFPLPADMLPNCECFILDVQGESMKGMGILDRGFRPLCEDERCQQWRGCRCSGG